MKATVCPECGYIETYTDDVTKIQKTIKEKKGIMKKTIITLVLMVIVVFSGCNQSSDVNDLKYSDGMIYFYNEATLQSSVSEIDSYKGSYQMNDPEKNELMNILKTQTWQNDFLTDRIAFYFDGQIYYQDNWIYFSYEQRIFYYEHYFCETTEETINIVKNLSTNT